MESQKINPKVDIYIDQLTKWQEEAKKLRFLLLESGLKEEIKWGKPCYTFEGKNIAIIQTFKDYFAILFFKGALLSDPHHILVKTGPNTEVGKQIKFTAMDEIERIAKWLPVYLDEAVEIAKSGLNPSVKEATIPPIPKELEMKFAEQPSLKIAFDKLTPGRRKHYLRHFNDAKQSKTKIARIEKSIPKILAGKGLTEL